MTKLPMLVPLMFAGATRALLCAAALLFAIPAHVQAQERFLDWSSLYSGFAGERGWGVDLAAHGDTPWNGNGLGVTIAEVGSGELSIAGDIFNDYLRFSYILR